MILDGQQPPSIAQAVQALRNGDLIGLPTETVYGLAADASNPAAVRQIFERKGRPANHPLIVHVASAQQASHFARDIPAFAQQLMQAFWPGPLTLIVPRQLPVAAEAAGGHPSVGLRCPSHPVAQKVLHACLEGDHPVWGVAAPSANRFGKVSPTTAAHVQGEFGDSLLVLDGGECAVGIESTIVDCTREEPIILRPGIIGAREMRQAIGRAVQDPFAVQANGQTPSAPEKQENTQQPAAPGTLKAHYAPNAKVRLMDAQSIQSGLDMLGEQATGIAIYTRTSIHTAAKGVTTVPMPSDPAQVAHELFATLRYLDTQGIGLIWVEIPPSDASWNGVRDRLTRAAASA